jgi:hypothetical protein
MADYDYNCGLDFTIDITIYNPTSSFLSYLGTVTAFMAEGSPHMNLVPCQSLAVVDYCQYASNFDCPLGDVCSLICGGYRFPEGYL